MSIRFQRRTGKWEADIKFLGEKYQIGTFNTKQEAQTKYDEIKKARERIKSEMKAEAKYPLENNSFAIDCYERGQEIKSICIDCCGGQQDQIQFCTNFDCEYFALKPVKTVRDLIRKD